MASRRSLTSWLRTPLAFLLLLTGLIFFGGAASTAACYKAGLPPLTSTYENTCYSSVAYLYPLRGFAERVYPYSSDERWREPVAPAQEARYPAGGQVTGAMEYPVLISYWAYGMAELTHASFSHPSLEEREKLEVYGGLMENEQVGNEAHRFLWFNAIGFLLLGLATTVLLSKSSSKAWAAAPFAASPLLALTGFLNWDMVAVVCVAAALYAWQKGKLGWVGVAIGLGTAAKLYPLFLLGAVLVLCLRQKRVKKFFLSLTAAVAAWLVVNIPAIATGPEEWKFFWEFHSQRPVDYGSVWLALDEVSSLSVSASTAGLTSEIIFALSCALILAWGVRSRREPTFAQLGLLIMVAFLLFNKVYSPQYVLWMLPLAAIALPSWKPQLIWQASEIFYFFAAWAYIEKLDPYRAGLLSGYGGGDWLYALAIGVRMAGELFLVYSVVTAVGRAHKQVPKELSTLPEIDGSSPHKA